MHNVKVKVKVAKVTRTYNGRVGCMCGCRGTYRYSTIAQDGPGFDIDDSRNDTAVKKTVNKINRIIASGDYDEVEIGPTYVYVQRGDRCHAAYFD